MRLLSPTLVIIGVILIITGAYLLQVTVKSHDNEIMGTMIGPTTFTLNPGGTHSYYFNWKISESTPKSISGKNYFIKEISSQPTICSYFWSPLLHIKTHCTQWVLGVKLVDISPQREDGRIIFIVIKDSEVNFTGKPIFKGRWVIYEIDRPGSYYTYLLNSGNETANLTVYYGLGVFWENKPYATQGLSLAITGIALLIGGSIYAFLKQSKEGKNNQKFN
ncbi:MAG: hypothetical protein GSR79_05315 [Desulfurococcales archaeon]|nr:hypothetical protein [Desulfurococcales archaeon]